MLVCLYIYGINLLNSAQISDQTCLSLICSAGKHPAGDSVSPELNVEIDSCCGSWSCVTEATKIFSLSSCQTADFTETGSGISEQQRHCHIHEPSAAGNHCIYCNWSVWSSGKLSTFHPLEGNIGVYATAAVVCYHFFFNLCGENMKISFFPIMRWESTQR